MDYDLLTDTDKQRLSDQADDEYYRQLKGNQERHWVRSQELVTVEAQLVAMPDDTALQDSRNALKEKLTKLEADITKLMAVEPSAERRAASLTRLGYV